MSQDTAAAAVGIQLDAAAAAGVQKLLEQCRSSNSLVEDDLLQHLRAARGVLASHELAMCGWRERPGCDMEADKDGHKPVFFLADDAAGNAGLIATAKALANELPAVQRASQFADLKTVRA